MDVKQKTALAVGAAVIGVGAALGVGYAVTGASAQAQSQTGVRGNGSGPGGGYGGYGGQNGSRGMGDLAAALAEKLGVDEDTVAQALREIMQANRPDGAGNQGTPPSSGAQPSQGARPGGSDQNRTGRDTAIAKALAAKLGLEESQVASALAEVRSEQQADRPDNGGGARNPQPSASA